METCLTPTPPKKKKKKKDAYEIAPEKEVFQIDSSAGW